MSFKSSWLVLHRFLLDFFFCFWCHLSFALDLEGGHLTRLCDSTMTRAGLPHPSGQWRGFSIEGAGAACVFFFFFPFRPIGHCWYFIGSALSRSLKVI